MNPHRHALYFLVPILVAASGFAGALHAPAPTPVHVLSFTPAEPEVSASALQAGMRVTFDRDMVLPAEVNKVVAGAAFDIAPAVAGDARWIDQRTLAFFAKAALQPSTTYRVRLATGFAPAPSLSIEAWPGVRFVYERIRVAQLNLDGNRSFMGTLPVAHLTLSQASSSKSVADACGFCEPRTNASGPCTRALVSSMQDKAPRTDTGFALTPERPLRQQSKYLVTCQAGLKPAQGDAGTLKESQQAFTTYGKAAVARVQPSGNDVAADEVGVLVAFTTPVDAKLVRTHVELVEAKGKAKPIDLAANWDQTTYAWSGDLTIDTAYEIRIKPGLADVFGQPLAPGKIGSFQVGDASPKLRMDKGIFVVERSDGHYPLWTRNLDSFHIRCAEVPEARLAAVLTGPSNYDAWWDAASSGDIDYKDLRLSQRQRTIRIRGARNKWHDTSVDLAAVCGNRAKSGVYLLETTAQGEINRRGQADTQVRRSLASVTDLGLVAKVGNASSLVWVVALSTGQPVAGATVKIRDLAGKVRFEGTTNADGVAQGPGASHLVKVKPRRQEAHGDDEEDGGEWEDYRARRVIVTAQTADDFAVLDTNWNNGIQVWNFGTRGDRGGGKLRVRGFLHSDRGLYRPGDTVHLKGLVRLMDVAGSMTVPPQKRRVHLVIRDPRNKMLVDENLVISEFGGFHKDLVVSADSYLGDYQVRGEIEGQSFSDRFAVEEYRARTFELKIGTAKKNLLLGRPLRFDVKANYLSRGAMSGGKLAYSVRRRPHLPAFPGFDDYVFQDYAELYGRGLYWARSEERSFSGLVEDGEIELDRAGSARITIKDKEKKLPGPQDYILQATVKDATGQSVSAGQVVVGHRSNLYLGLHPAECVQAVDMPFAVQLVGFDIEGNRRAAQAELEIVRRSYDCGPHGENSQWSCVADSAKQPAVKRTVAVPASGSAAVERVVLKEPGEYVVRVSANGQGEKAVASDMIWVIGKGEAFWSGDEGDRMTVIASKSKYAPGDTALLVPQTQMAGALALLTLERDGILSYSTTRLASTGQALPVKVTPELAPNVFASVVLLRGRTGEGDRNRPRFKMGLVNLNVEAAAQRLQVSVETEKPSYEPGQAVKARVLVTSAAGEPVRAELALAVADEGVLQIVGFKTPDPMAAFYAPFGLGVESATTWNRILRRHDPDRDDEEEGGDGGGDEAGRIRSRFVATAFWAPALVTGPDGRVEVTFKAPDNLTAFRVMAVAADAGTCFGSGEKRFTVAKRLQAVPALPRFLAPGDRAQAAVAIHNNTSEKLEVTVTATIAGLTMRGGSTRKIKVPAHALRRVVFDVAAEHDGEASFLFKAEAQSLVDRVLMRIPVRRASIPETVMVGEGGTQAAATHVLPALGEVVPGQGGLELSLDRTGMGRLDEGLAYLVGYPYGCLEQTTSKVVPMIALSDLVHNAHLPGIEAGQARKFIEIGIAKILRHQHDDGGFGLWIGAAAEPHYTVTGLWGLSVAKAAGFKVDQEALDKGVQYLRGHMSRGESLHGNELLGQRGTDAFAEYVLATLNHADAGALARLYENRASLPIYGRAFLLRGLVAANRTDLSKSLANELLALASAAPQAGLIHEVPGELSWYWSSDARTTALVSWALTTAAPGDSRLAQLTDALLKARQEGHWANTQENLFGLLALADLAKMRASAGKVSVSVRLGDKTLARKTIAAAAVEHVFVPLAKLGAGPLVITAENGEVFYSARIRVERPMASEALDRGLTVEREYLDAKNKTPLETIQLGQTVLIRLKVQSPLRRAHIAVVDRLPAGFEPVLARFSNEDNWRENAARPHWWHDWNTSWQNEELRDDRVQIFADTLGQGTSTHEYRVRATTTGTFSVPPALAEAMYDPAIQGRSAMRTVEIVR
jgi:uncharacterized protein YfaS (alpha-2-macroglobulin family)